MGANRRFGLVLVIAFGVIYASQRWFGDANSAWLAAALILALVTLLMPRVLQPLLGVWMRIGWLLHVVVMSTRGGCLDPDAQTLSRTAWNLLHKRYADSEWTDKTPYFY